MSTTRSVGVNPGPFPRSRVGTLIAGCIAVAVAIAVPGLTPNLNGLLTASLHISGAQLNWVGDSGFVGASAAAYAFGSLADRIGRRRLLVTGSFFVLVGEVISGLSTTVHVMWTGQAIAGIGAGGMAAISLAVVTGVARNAPERARYMAAFAGSLTAGPIISSLLGGLLSQGTSYEWAFVGMGIIAAFGGLLIYLLAIESRHEHPRRLDLAGQVTLIVCVFAGLWGVIEGAATHWANPAVIVAFIIALLAAIAFVLIERRPGGMVELSMFRRPTFTLATITALVSGFTFVGVNYAYAIRLTIGQGHTPLFSAWGLIVEAAVAGATGFGSRWVLQQRVGARVLVSAGFLCFAGAGFWLAAEPLSDSSFTAMLGMLILTGIAQATTTAGMSAAAVGSVPPELHSEAASTQGVMRQVGPPLGVAIGGAIIFSRSQGILAGLIGHLGLPASVAQAALGVNSAGGVLGVLGSGMGAKVPALGAAAGNALNGAIGDACRVVAVISLVLAVSAVVGLRGGADRPAQEEKVPADVASGNLAGQA